MAFKYRGILAKPCPYEPIPGPLADDKAFAAWKERYARAELERWRALYKAHGVEPGDADELLWRMAETHVPGFKAKAKSGPRQIWDMTTKAELRIAVDDYIASRKQQGKSASVVHACHELATRDPWKAMLRKIAGKQMKPVEALRGHYNTADLRWVNVVRDARVWAALPEHEKTAYQKVLGRALFGFARNLPQETSRRKKSS